jgi:hypothetical protein
MISSMKCRFQRPFTLVFLIIFICSCNKNNPLVTDTPADYYPMHVGNYIIYRMDSLEYINVGSTDTIISYLAKEVVDDSITDNLGNLSYRVIRYLSDTTETAPWTPSIAYMVTPSLNSVQTVENNLRFIKLVTPVQDGLSWSGNSYIDTENDSLLTFMAGWNYTYSNTGQPFNTIGGTVPQSVIVNEANIINGDAGGNAYVETIFSEEVYGKNIGCIYKTFLHSVYQPPDVQYPSGATIGYGLTFNMVSHN